MRFRRFFQRSAPFRLAWLTDIHLNFLGLKALNEFFERAARLEADAYVISGDIGEAESVRDYLEAFSHTVARPVYFVLGNHDFYRSGILAVRQQMTSYVMTHPHLRYLTISNVIPLTPEVGLIGHDGWADGRYGDFMASSLMLNDYLLIEELAASFAQGKAALWATLQGLADEAARSLERRLTAALAQYALVFVVLHPPPFAENTLHQGRLSTPAGLPHFSCKAVGDVLLACAAAHPQRQMIVLCGHTHCASDTRPRPNLQVISGQAAYRAPTVQRVFAIE